MKRKAVSVIKPSLEETQKKFEEWRSTKSKRCPIPEKLWEEAISLYPAHSINQISRALSLNYVDLKGRIQHKASSHTPTSSSPDFIEIGMIESQLETEWIMELEEQNGSRMRLTFRGKREVSFVEMARAFWSKDR